MKSMQLFFQHLVKMVASISRAYMFANHDNDVAEHGGNSANSISTETYSRFSAYIFDMEHIYIVRVN